MTNTEMAALAQVAAGTSSPWMSMQEAADYSRCHYQTVFQACRRYTDGDRSSKALKNFQDGPGCKRNLLRADVDRWVQRLPPARATRIP
jgi:hypothetical protein